MVNKMDMCIDPINRNYKFFRWVFWKRKEEKKGKGRGSNVSGETKPEKEKRENEKRGVRMI